MQNSLSAGLAFCFGSQVPWVDATLLILKAEPLPSYSSSTPKAFYIVHTTRGNKFNTYFFP